MKVRLMVEDRRSRQWLHSLLLGWKIEENRGKRERGYKEKEGYKVVRRLVFSRRCVE